MSSPTLQPSVFLQEDQSSDPYQSLDYILPLTIVGGLALSTAAGALYYYCNIPRATISLDDVEFFYNKFPET